MAIKRAFTFRWGLMLFLVGLLISACAANTEALLPEPTATQAEKLAPSAVVVEEASGSDAPPEGDPVVLEEQPVEESAETPSDPRIPEPELGFDYGDPNLKATAPSSFVRASGQPQLVELFAFW